MPSPVHLEIISRGVEAWNAWRANCPEILPDLEFAQLARAQLPRAVLRQARLAGASLTDADLYWANLEEADLRWATLTNANLRRAILYSADLRGATLSGANLTGAQLASANLHGADLREASFSSRTPDEVLLEPPGTTAYYREDYRPNVAELGGANLREADLRGSNLCGALLGGADLRRADLRQACLVGAYLGGVNLTGANLGEADLRQADLRNTMLLETNLSSADLQGADLRHAVLVRVSAKGSRLNGCRVYGVSVWDFMTEDTSEQRGLVVTPEHESAITVDNLEVAQFLYLLIRSRDLRNVIDTITSKVVLVLGRFTSERKAVLDAIREALRKHHDYVPVVFDFDKPSTRDTQETITLLARMARFIIADISEARSIPQELAEIVPNLPSVPIQPILREGDEPWAMYDHIQRYPWVLPLQRYRALHELLTRLVETVIAPAEAKLAEIRRAPW